MRRELADTRQIPSYRLNHKLFRHMTGYDSCGVPGAADADPVPSETRQTDSVVGCWPGYWWSQLGIDSRLNILLIDHPEFWCPLHPGRCRFHFLFFLYILFHAVAWSCR